MVDLTDSDASPRRGSRFRESLRVISALIALLIVPTVASADTSRDARAGSGIQVKTLADGTRMIFNENKVQRARRTSSRLLPVPTANDLDTIIRKHALAQGLSPRLVQSVIQVESGYNVKALSNKGAIGLMQLMPATARDLGVRDPWNPDQNVSGGTRYLSQQLDRFDGDLTLALAAYNAGPGAVERHGGVPPYQETQRYVEKVLGLYQKNPPKLLREYAEQRAKLQQRRADAKRAKKAGERGKSVYVTRDANNNIVFTTEPPN